MGFHSRLYFTSGTRWRKLVLLLGVNGRESSDDTQSVRRTVWFCYSHQVKFWLTVVIIINNNNNNNNIIIVVSTYKNNNINIILLFNNIILLNNINNIKNNVLCTLFTIYLLHYYTCIFNNLKTLLPLYFIHIYTQFKFHIGFVFSWSQWFKAYLGSF